MGGREREKRERGWGVTLYAHFCLGDTCGIEDNRSKRREKKKKVL